MPRKLPRIEPQFKYDYILYISTEYDEVRRKRFLKFLLETTQNFLAFNYELDVDVLVEDKKQIEFKIRGLKPPSLPLSQSGPAKFEYRLYDYINGVYTLTIVKKENVKNVFKVLVMNERVTLKDEPKRNKFVKLNII